MTVEEVEHDDPAPHEVIVRTVAVGLCHSDYHVIDGVLDRPRPIILGHEAAGEVIAIGSDVTSVSIGDRVATCLVMGCGDCPRCRRGEPAHCSNQTSARRPAGAAPRISRDGQAIGQMTGVGALCEEMIISDRAVTRLPDSIPLHLAPLLGCAVVTGLGAVLTVAQAQPEDSVAVIGCGGVGIAVIQGARIAGVRRIIAVDMSAAKLAMARTFGATDVVDASQGDPVAQVRELTGGEGVDHAFEVVGRESTVQQAFEMAAFGRRAYALGIHADDAPVTIPTVGLRRGKSLVGVFMGDTQPRLDIPRYAGYWADGKLDLESMVSHTLALEQANEGFALMAGGEAARVVITF